MMRASDVLEVIARLTEAGVRIWLDGGWGIDALLGVQTREHDDLDVVISLSDADSVQRSLAAPGFVVSKDELPTRFVVRDRHDRRVDFHTVTFEADGSAIQRLQDGTPWRYPAEGFAGVGRLGGHDVACLTPEVQLISHLGYEPDETDHQDMRALADRFGLVLPPPYRT